MTILILRVFTQFFHEFQFESSSSFFVCSLYTLFMRRILFCISIENFIEMLPLIYHGRSIYKPNFYYQQFYFVRSVISILFMMTYARLRFHFIYIYYEFYIYLQLFTTILIHVRDVMAYVSFGYENWLIVLASW